MLIILSAKIAEIADRSISARAHQTSRSCSWALGSMIQSGEYYCGLDLTGVIYTHIMRAASTEAYTCSIGVGACLGNER